MRYKKTDRQKSAKQDEPQAEKKGKADGQTEDLQIERDELFAKLQRVSADYENFQKRVQKQITDAIGYEKERIIKALLPVLDNFEHTLQNAHSGGESAVFVKGVQIIYDQMLDILKSHSAERIKALGEKFDPSLHQAVMQRYEPDKEEDIVLEEFQKGYRLNGRVIRPSKVIVNKPLQQDSERQQEQITEEYETTDTE